MTDPNPLSDPTQPAGPWYSRLHIIGSAQALLGLIASLLASPLIIEYPKVAALLMSASGLCVMFLHWFGVESTNDLKK